MIHIDSLFVRREGKAVCSVPELVVERGERVAIVGSNGSGKSTLLRVIAGLLDGFEGTCAVDAPERERVFVHQDPWLFRGTVRRNLGWGLRGRGGSASSRRELEDHWLGRLGIADLAERPASRVSGGERRRTALGRAMILSPQLLLLDEPLADLDREGAVALEGLLREQAESTILIAAPFAPPPGFVDRVVELTAP